MSNESNHELRTPRLDAVQFNGGFWGEKVQVNRHNTLPVEFEQLATTHRLEILNGDWTEASGYTPHIFWDSDVAKWIEAAAYSLSSHPDAELEAQCDDAIGKIAKLQQEDGYFNSYFIQVEPENRWTNLRDRHELYCAGHLMEAAVAYFEATGKREFLDVMCRYADYIDSVFGPGEKKHGYPGHEEIELALVKLYKVTGETRYLTLSKFFVDERGTQPHYFDVEAAERGEEPAYYWGGYEYTQAHVPVREQKAAEGHSVRAGYLYAGMADVAREAADPSLAQACRDLWRNIVDKRLYVHGGIGPCHVGERFSFDYDLPNEEAYAETCAAIALVFFAQRMFLLDRKSEYIDVLERALYNGVISGVSGDGRKFFYDNYLASHPEYHSFRKRKSPDRQEWFGCACCPPNLARLLASLGGYLYVHDDETIWLNLYADYASTVDLAGATVDIRMSTGYPWDGGVSVSLDPDAQGSFALKLRIPDWCRSWSVSVNGTEIRAGVIDGYATIEREWSPGDRVQLHLDMKPERIAAHPSVRHDVAKIALQRGPLIYCLEEIDNGKDLNNFFLPADAELSCNLEPELLGGVVTISGIGKARSYSGWESSLYRPASIEFEERKFKAVPYYAWDNRGVGEMLIWMNMVD